VHLQWLTAPQVDARLLRLRAPCVFTAHDLLPRRTARRRGLWLRILSRFDAVVVHSENGRSTLIELGVPEGRLRVIPLAISPTEGGRADDGRTLLLFGVLRPYKGLPDALELVRRIHDTRLVVAGDPAMPLERTSDDNVDWRLGYLGEEEVRRALSEATVAVFPYRPELDQSAALATVLGAGVPAVAYDVNGVAEPVRRFGAGRVVPAGDIAELERAVRELLDDADALAAARAGAARGRGGGPGAAGGGGGAPPPGGGAPPPPGGAPAAGARRRSAHSPHRPGRGRRSAGSPRASGSTPPVRRADRHRSGSVAGEGCGRCDRWQSARPHPLPPRGG
jgi:glycosyltransferase involved in cell wall biosynthesis